MLGRSQRSALNQENPTSTRIGASSHHHMHKTPAAKGALGGGGLQHQTGGKPMMTNNNHAGATTTARTTRVLGAKDGNQRTTSEGGQGTSHNGQSMSNIHSVHESSSLRPGCFRSRALEQSTTRSSHCVRVSQVHPYFSRARRLRQDLRSRQTCLQPRRQTNRSCCHRRLPHLRTRSVHRHQACTNSPRCNSHLKQRMKRTRS